MKRRYLLLLGLWCCLSATVSWAQPAGTGTYYQKAHGKKGRELKTAMYEIINSPSVMDYDSLWTAYRYSDAIPTDTVPIIWDMYSCKSAYSIYTNLHRNGAAADPEGVKGFQREHSMPKSWFNTAGSPYKDIWPHFSDLTHLIPAEGKVNNKRSNNPYGETTGEDYELDKKKKTGYKSEDDFSKLGLNTYGDYVGTVFEPNDMYKGDLARIYFYMVTAYEKKQPTWSSTGDGIGDHCGTWTGDMFNLEDDDPYQPFAPWAFSLLMKWAKEDPVSKKEIDRNEAIYRMQGNRNPFVDYADPLGGGLEDYIWGDKKDVAFDYGGEPLGEEAASDNCELALNKSTFGVEWHPSDARKEELTNAGKDWTLYDNLREYLERTPLTVSQNHVDISYKYGIYGRYQYADANQIRMYNYNTLTFKAHNNKITKIEFTLGDNNHNNKKLKAFVGTLDGNVWTGEEDEVLFTTEYVASTYNSGTKTTTNYYQGIKNVKVTVATPTGIEQMKAERFKDDRIFNLVGVQMKENQLTPGFYIKNGRKVIIK